jgi:membrane-associated protein
MTSRAPAVPRLRRVLLANPLSPDTLLTGSGALLVLCVILFIECGVLLGFFLPGDTLLFAAGVSIETHAITTPLWAFLIAAPLAVIAGNLLGYAVGYRAGPVVFDRPDSALFRPEYVERSHRFFERFGSWTVIFAFFIPVVRTVAAAMAGVARMRLSLYALYSVIGAVVWTDGVLLLGHQLGKIGFVQRNKGYIDYIVLAVVVIGLIPAGVHYLQARRRRR